MFNASDTALNILDALKDPRCTPKEGASPMTLKVWLGYPYQFDAAWWDLLIAGKIVKHEVIRRSGAPATLYTAA